MMKKMKRCWSLFAAALLALTGCDRESILPGETEIDPYEEGLSVTIPFEVTGGELVGSSSPETRTVILNEETPIETIHVAVFGGSGYLKEYVKAQEVTRLADSTYVDNGRQCRVARYRFKVTLTVSESRRIVHFIVNGPSTLSFDYADAVVPPLLSGLGQRAYWQMKTLDKGIRALKSSHETPYVDHNGRTVHKGDFIDENADLVVDGKGYVPDQETRAAFKDIPLIKNWAKIVLGTEEDSFFTPYSYAIINVPARGTIAPYNAKTKFIADYQNYTFQAINEMGYAGSLPVDVPFDTDIPSAEDFQTFSNGVTKADANGAVYIFERPVPTSEMRPSAVIVYGHYRNPADLDNEGDYYYKVDLMEGNAYYPLLRNFQYQIKIIKILSQGQYTPAAAAVAAGSADVSADIVASHLSDISDGQGRMVVSPWMSHTFTSKVNDGLLQAFFVDDVLNWHVSTDPDAVRVEKLPMASEGEEDVIESLWIDPPITDIEESIGWRNIHFTTKEPGTVSHTQTIRISGDHVAGTLYRDIVITLQPLQRMMVRCKPRIANTKDTYQLLEIVIPEGLAESMFPLVFWIEPERMTLTPDGTKASNNLPVTDGKSISENPEYAGKSSFHYERTLSWDEYRTLLTERDEDGGTWRVLPCHFRSNCGDSGTTIWVQNEFFISDDASFTTFRDMTFRNLKFTCPIVREENSTVTVHFDVDEDPTYHYPEDYPEITLEAFQMQPTTAGLEADPNVPGTYRFKPTASSVDLTFITQTDDGDLRLNLSAPEYGPQTLRSHFFQGFGFVSGHRMWKTSGWSNVIGDYVNYDKNKAVLFGYYDDPDAPNTEISLQNVVGLTFLTPSSYPWTPSGPRSTNGVATYHEIELRTPGGTSLDRVEFDLCSDGYVTEYVSAKRFRGNVLTQDGLTVNTLFKPDNTYGFSVDTPTFTAYQNPNQTEPTFTVSFDHITELRSDQPQGMILGQGGRYKMTIRSNSPDDYKIFYVQLNIRTGYTWAGTRRNLGPVLAQSSASIGDFYLYPGDNKQYIWELPLGTTEAELTLAADPDYPINITDLIVKTYMAVFQE